MKKTNSKVDNFLELTDSLSRYRRAGLTDFHNNNIIEDLYVDPLDDNLILKSMLKNNTTLLIGRKGTGKSTIINRFQHEIRKNSEKVSLYIDVNSIFEQSRKSILSDEIKNNTLSQENQERLHLYILFIKNVIDEIKKEINSNLFSKGFKSLFTKKLSETQFKKSLESLFDKICTPTYTDNTLRINLNSTESNSYITENNKGITPKLSIQDLSMAANITKSNKNELITSEEISRVLARQFNIISFMRDLKVLLQKISIKGVFICLDDMSEIDKESMEIFCDFIIGPLNNLSDEFFKFKIALYPGRDYLPSIDRQKVKTYYLDYYDLYSVGNADQVEESAIKYTKKIIDSRIKYYFNDANYFTEIFDVNTQITREDYYKILFQISSNVPRIMGKVLEIAMQKTNSLEKKINKKILQESAKQHYKNDIEYVLTKSEYIEYKSYDEAFEKYHLYNLLKIIIKKAIDNKKHIGASNAKIFDRYTTNTAPSNYLFVNEDFEEALKTLEFNFFITKYTKQKDKDGISVSIFSLNYGLCIDNNIIFDEKSDRKFRIERIFDFNKTLIEWMNSSKELRCNSCSKKFDIEKKDVFIKYNMPCPECHGKVELKPIINKEKKEKIEKYIRIPQREYDVLNVLKIKESASATEIGSELDKPYQSINYCVGKNSKILNYKFIERKVVKGIARFIITESGNGFLNGKNVYKNNSNYGLTTGLT